MDKESKTTQQIIPLAKASYWRDEMNFAEFPLAALDSSTAAKSLVFEDTIFDPGTKQFVSRKLTVSPSTEYGLPTTADEEVLLGLLQLTAKRSFASPTVHFTRYELLKELGWDTGQKAYKRIDEALKKWLGVTLYYDNAWWSNEEKCWVSEHFHVLEHVTILDNERRNRQRAARPTDPTRGLSSFVWNQHVFRSFEDGYLKKLDFEFFTSLGTPVAKRIYRFLDKHFYKKATWYFDLRDFACEHIGLSKNYSNSKLKERLRAAISELEEKGFLERQSDEARYEKVTRGNWRIHFRRGPAARKSPAEKSLPSVPATTIPFPGTAERIAPEIQKFIRGLSDEKREKLEAAAIKAAGDAEKRLLKDCEKDGPVYEALKARVVEKYVEQRAKKKKVA